MLALLDATSPLLTPYASAVSAFVALLAFVLGILAFRAASRRGNPGLRWVGAAFLAFALKDVFAAAMVVTHAVPHDGIELILSGSDLVIIALLFVPLLFRRRG